MQLWNRERCHWSRKCLRHYSLSSLQLQHGPVLPCIESLLHMPPVALVTRMKRYAYLGTVSLNVISTDKQAFLHHSISLDTASDNMVCALKGNHIWLQESSWMKELATVHMTFWDLEALNSNTTSMTSFASDSNRDQHESGPWIQQRGGCWRIESCRENLPSKTMDVIVHAQSS